MVARLSDDFSRGRAAGLSPCECDHDHSAVPGAACRLRREALACAASGCVMSLRSLKLRRELWHLCSRLLGLCAQARARAGAWRFFSAGCAACYWGALSRFVGDAHNRNRRVCATYAVALLLAGSLLLFPVDFQVPFLCLAAVTAAFLYVRTGKLSLGMHVSLYLLAAAILSGLLNFVGNALAGTVPSGWTQARGWSQSRLRILLCHRIACFDRSSGMADRHSDDQGAERMEAAAALDRPLAAGGGRAAALAVMLSVRLGSAGGC